MVSESLETTRLRRPWPDRTPPAGSLLYAARILLSCLPQAQAELSGWRRRAVAIACPRCRPQALGSLGHKAFHSLGAATFGALAHPAARHGVVRFAVALQTLSDYLDSLADRGAPLSLWECRRIHQAMVWAVDPWARPGALRLEDGGYLRSLVGNCQASAATLPGYLHVVARNRRLASLYACMQALKHSEPGARRRSLSRWAQKAAPEGGGLAWWELAAACGSTLAILALTAQATHPGGEQLALESVEAAYFPWICALHILLDYLIDEEEDATARELNFVACYRGRDRAAARIVRLFEKSRVLAAGLTGGPFHRMVVGGLAALYLTDPKAAGRWAWLLDELATRDLYVATLRPLVLLWRATRPPAPPQGEPVWARLRGGRPT